MKEDKETRKKLLASGKAEFLEKGFMKASLRNICRNAGVTTGALYFFFQDKEDLFASIVEKPLEKLYQVISHHFQEENDLERIPLTYARQNHEEDLRSSLEIIELLFQYREEFILMVFKSQGTRFEQTVDKLVVLSQEQYTNMAAIFSAQIGCPKVDPSTIHWVSHVQIEAFLYVLSHADTVEEAKKDITPIISYLTAGWYGLFQK